METKAKFLETIKQYKDYDTEIIGKAYDKAKLLHEGQLRKSGEPYLIPQRMLSAAFVRAAACLL